VTSMVNMVGIIVPVAHRVQIKTVMVRLETSDSIINGSI
jgi:hypothetical protein